MVELRLNPRLKSRIDPSDILQEVYLEASHRLDAYLRERPMPLFLWLRRLTGQKLRDVHRHHLGTRKRTAGKEIRLDAQAAPDATSASMAARLVGRDSSPSEAAVHEETRVLVQEALDRMDPLDREALALRFFERLTSEEVGQVLGVHGGTARMRYFRALKRLREILGPDVLKA
jgi:RNA polymerase sigma-70 factor (ECF subfamily)